MPVLKFGRFELDPSQRKLTESGKTLQLGGKAFDILAVLASSAGEIISKEKLIAQVWPDTTVEEGALRVHLVTLRKLLGDRQTGRYIENVPGRGYVFVMPVEIGVAPSQPREPTAVRRLHQSLPRLTERLIGRDSMVAEISSLVSQNRIVTIAGTGGVGKTSVALAVAEIASAEREVLFVDLGSLSEESEIIPTLATLLGFNSLLEDTRQAVLDALCQHKYLILLDNCEHLIASIAVLVEDVIAVSDDVTVLATSREPLRVLGERIRQLPSLAVPPEDARPSDIRSYPAVELFVDRVLLSSERESFGSNETISAAAEVVRRLDGIPLAIELAASGAANLGLAHLVGSLDNPLSVLRRGRRTAPPRQQTLRATLDWSFENLTEKERLLFDYLAMFAGAFSTDAALTISASAMSTDDFYQAFDGLFLKSLLSVSGGDGNYRLLQTTRSYALEKVEQSGNRVALRLAHAAYCENALSRAASDWTSLPTADWMRRYGDLIHDIRSAINWTLETEGVSHVGVELASSSNIFWVQLGLMNEQINVIERALKRIVDSPLEGTETELDLRLSRGGALYHMRGFPADTECFAEFRRAVEIADSIGNVRKLVTAQSGLTALLTSHGRYGEAIEQALELRERYTQLPRETFSRMLEHNYLFHGDLRSSRDELAGSFRDASGEVRRTANHGMGFDQRIIALAVLVFVDFLEGKIIGSLTVLEESVAEAKKLDYAIVTCLLLMLSAFPINFLVGRRSIALGHLDTAEKLAKEHRLIRWQQWIKSYRQLLLAEDQNDSAMNTVLADAYGMRLEYLVVVAGTRAPLDQIERALAGDGGWCRAEVLRLKAIAVRPTDPVAANAFLQEATDTARLAGAIFWELRCALTAYEFEVPEQRSTEDLAAIVARFEPGSRTDDLSVASEIVGLTAPRFG
ncbi:helix-turn-helix transcriptional regulator [Rhizobiaceae bacterium n13]|uniref:Helix-turn-helix transcriptional regulator n=1 Tax=Ferirhizobium litorale TaxID=2927786 RepID=A0AAE3Q7B5_9HYPH|nr:winged helix-turn-helix domain-containing protein [Fererhizobium litorale]MDI7860342.1 helix-turn-helix transcriptional regulator [Fererhizobium litorale]MDI7920477.1 helix-turn-helix transcriptional regulator [Fererhizobium litorale]